MTMATMVKSIANKNRGINHNNHHNNQNTSKRKHQPTKKESSQNSSSSNNNNNNKSKNKDETSSSSSSGVCQNVSERYEKVGRIGQGTYGIVYKARDGQTGEYVALKRCIPHHESSDGFPLTTLREIQALRICSWHPNIVTLQTVAVSNSGVFLVFDYCSRDLAQILDSYYPKHHSSPFDESQVKALTQQLLSALEFCHAHSLLHRDIKPSNLLYDDKRGMLQLADFGLSRHVSHSRLTPNVVSLWYRAPELLWNHQPTNYTFAIDLWAVGCVLTELLQGFPLLDGRSEVEQMQQVVKCLGSPPYAGANAIHIASKAKSDGSAADLHLLDRMEFMPAEGLTLLTKLLEYRPDQRWTATQALQSKYFTSALPRPAIKMPKFDNPLHPHGKR